MGEHPGVQRARESLEMAMAGEFDRLGDFYADDVRWHVAGHHPLSGDYEGRDALIAYLRRVRSLTAGALVLEPESILASDQHTAMFVRVTGEREGRQLDTLLAEVLRVGPDGRWNEYWAMAEDQEAVDAFWASEDDGRNGDE